MTNAVPTVKGTNMAGESKSTCENCGKPLTTNPDCCDDPGRQQAEYEAANRRPPERPPGETTYPRAMLEGVSKALASAAEDLEKATQQAASARRLLLFIARALSAEAIDPRPSDLCERCSPPCARQQQCRTCGRTLPHDYVHWNGDFEECEHCAISQASPHLAVVQADLLR